MCCLCICRRTCFRPLIDSQCWYRATLTGDYIVAMHVCQFVGRGGCCCCCYTAAALFTHSTFQPFFFHMQISRKFFRYLYDIQHNEIQSKYNHQSAISVTKLLVQFRVNRWELCKIAKTFYVIKRANDFPCGKWHFRSHQLMRAEWMLFELILTLRPVYVCQVT